MPAPIDPQPVSPPPQDIAGRVRLVGGDAELLLHELLAVVRLALAHGRTGEEAPTVCPRARASRRMPLPSRRSRSA